MTRVLAAPRLAAMVGTFDRSPAYAGLAAVVQDLVADGRVPVGTRLPSERDLTAALDVSRTTVARAYAALREAGFVTSRQGSGSVVSLPPGRGHRGDHLLAPVDGAPEGSIDLTCAAPAALPALAAAYERAAAAMPAHLAGTGYFPSGTGELRAAVAASYDARGLATDPDQVVVVPGALSGIALAARCLVGPGDRALLESPTYSNAIAALGRAGARVVGTEVGVGDAAADLEGWTTTLRQVLPRVAYLVADFHNPTGALRSDTDRERLAATMRRTRTTAIVDEAMMPLALDGQEMPRPFAAYAADAITVGTASKSHWGGLRVGWLRVPERNLDAVLTERLAYDCGTPVLEQLVAADLLGQGLPLLEERRALLRASRDTAYARVGELLPDWSVTLPGGGLCLWCRLPDSAPAGATSSALAARARAHGLLLAPGPAFAPEGGLDRYVRIPFTQPAPVMADAVERLARAWQETCASPAPAPRRAGAPATASSPVLVA